MIDSKQLDELIFWTLLGSNVFLELTIGVPDFLRFIFVGYAVVYFANLGLSLFVWLDRKTRLIEWLRN